MLSDKDYKILKSIKNGKRAVYDETLQTYFQSGLILSNDDDTLFVTDEGLRWMTEYENIHGSRVSARNANIIAAVSLVFSVIATTLSILIPLLLTR